MLADYNWLTPPIRFSLSFLSSLFLTWVLMPKYINFVLKKTGVQAISEYLKKTGDHGQKVNTPTTGGVIIILASILASVIFGSPESKLYQIVVITGFMYGLLGFLDDLSKIRKRANKGLLIRLRLLFELTVACAAVFLIRAAIDDSDFSSYVFIKSIGIKLGFLCFLMQLCVIVGSSNAVNMTDGLDGLVSIPAIASFTFMAIFAAKMPDIYSGSAVAQSFLRSFRSEDIVGLIVLCSSAIGSIMGFLWFNAKPAKIFMGDTGSLFIGSTIGAISVITKSELFLLVVGGLFVWETVSVIIQLTSLKTVGKRVFLMAPIHHHYEIKGWQETQIVVRFWIISLSLCIVGVCLII